LTAKELVSKTDEEIVKFLVDHKDEDNLGLKNAKVIVNAFYKYQIFKVLKKVETIIEAFGMGNIKSHMIYFRNNDNTFTKIGVTYFFHDEARVDICVCDLKTDTMVGGSFRKIKYDGKRVIQ
jgi:hypothetical protein